MIFYFSVFNLSLQSILSYNLSLYPFFTVILVQHSQLIIVRNFELSSTRRNIYLKQMSSPQHPTQHSNLIQFKQQTMTLLREQSHKLKQQQAQFMSQHQQLSIRTEQIKFLKQTIIQLQGENLQLTQQRNECKDKLEKIVNEVQSYNETVVKPICVERQKLKHENMELRQKDEQMAQLMVQMEQQLVAQKDKIAKLHQQLQLQTSQAKQQQITNLQLQQRLQKQQQSARHHFAQTRRLTTLLNQSQQSKLQLTNQSKILNKQLSSVISKHNQTIKDYEQKINERDQSRVDIAEVQKCNEQIKMRQGDITRLKGENATLKKTNEEVRHKLLSDKETLSKQLARTKMASEQLMTDLVTLAKSYQLNKKIVEFQSTKSDLFYRLYEQYGTIVQQNQQLKLSIEQCLIENQSLKLQCERLSNVINDSEVEQVLLRTRMSEQLERVESTYQGKLVTMGLKIKQEEDALERLKKNELDMAQHNETLAGQLQVTRLEFDTYKHTTQHSLAKVNQENQKLARQMQQLYQVCEENVDSKRIVDRMKHVVNALLTAVYYLDGKLSKIKDMQKSVYMPIVLAFLQLSKKVDQMSDRQRLMERQHNPMDLQKVNVFPCYSKKGNPNVLKPTSMRKLRACVWTVITIIRLQRATQNKSHISQSLTGLPYRVIKSLTTRNKIPNMSELLQRQQNVLQSSEEVETTVIDLLKVTENIFKWQDHGVQRMKVDMARLFGNLERINRENGEYNYNDKEAV